MLAWEYCAVGGIQIPDLSVHSWTFNPILAISETLNFISIDITKIQEFLENLI